MLMSVVVVAVDPGIRGCGVAVFRDSVLVAAAYVASPVESGNQTAACLAMALAVWAWVRDVLGLPANSPPPSAWGWLVATFPAASAWLRSLLGFDLHAATLPGELVFEWPRMYQVARQEGDQNDLPPLAGVDCAIAAMFPSASVTTYYPDEWKGGQVPKRVMNDRVWERLTPDEQSRVARRARGSLDHNTLDAVGIGMRYLGRLARRRQYG